MEEVDYLCAQICIINKGKIIEFDTPQLLKQKYGSTKKDRYYITCQQCTSNIL